MFSIAISAGNTARNPKNATPPPMIGMLSALFSAQARRTICFHPCQGISVGLSAEMPGSCCSSGAPTVDGRLGRGEDGALQRRGEDDLLHRVLALQCIRSVVLVRHALPDLFE